MQLRQFERLNFITGQLLSAEDLKREQDYHREKACLRNRLLHGWGVVTGLSVSLDPGQGSVVVSPGVALDCAGNELVLPAEVRCPLSGLSALNFVTIGYVEVATGHVPSTGDVSLPRFTREAVNVEISQSDPMAGHAAFPPGSPGCGQSHALGLAIVRQMGPAWHVFPCQTGLQRHK